MRFRLLPTDDRFFELFNDAAANVAECARRLSANAGTVSRQSPRPIAANYCRSGGSSERFGSIGVTWTLDVSSEKGAREWLR